MLVACYSVKFEENCFYTEGYTGPYQMAMTEYFAKIVNG